jgi:hypothetical protein
LTGCTFSSEVDGPTVTQGPGERGGPGVGSHSWWPIHSAQCSSKSGWSGNWPSSHPSPTSVRPPLSRSSPRRPSAHTHSLRRSKNHRWARPLGSTSWADPPLQVQAGGATGCLGARTSSASGTCSPAYCFMGTSAGRPPALRMRSSGELPQGSLEVTFAPTLRGRSAAAPNRLPWSRQRHDAYGVPS